MQIFGHRGAPSPLTPENTLAGVTAALASGADGVEVDVRLTSDDVAVCCHDPGLDRVAGVSRGVRALTAAQLAAVRVQGHAIPSVAAVVDAMPRDRTLVLDLKPEKQARRLLVSLLDVLAQFPEDRLVLSSFDEGVLSAAAVLAPAVPRACILAPGRPFSQALAGALRRGDAAMHLPMRTVFDTPELVQVCHGHGIAVRAWTVNRSVDARLLDVLAVDGIITDVPGLLMPVVRQPTGLFDAQP